MHRKHKVAYRISAEMLSVYLFKKIINIEMIEFDKDREVLHIYASGDDLPMEYKTNTEMAEGDSHPVAMIPRPDILP